MMKTYHAIPMQNISIRSLIFLAMLTLAACSSKKAPENPSEEAEVIALPESGYELTKNQFQSSGMKLGKLEMQNFHEVVKANGMFDVPPKNRVSVSAYFGGYVKDIQLLPGEQVKKGQILFLLGNPDYVQLQQDFLEAQGQLVYLKSDYERQKNLVKDNVTSEKNYLKAEADYTVTRVKYESLKKKLELMNIKPSSLTLENIVTTVKITSPIDGYVTKVNITQGEFLNASNIAITIINTNHMHLELNIFEKDLAKVAIGQQIEFRTQEIDSKTYKGVVYLVNKTVDPESRTIGIHGHLSDENNTHKFNPGMYVQADIYTTSESKTSLPQDAIVEVEGTNYVLVLKSSSEAGYTFEKHEVSIGHMHNGYIEILNSKDFPEDSQFLIDGAFNLITE
ncbi:efflux RND transporter periplasmic adaptor subunit [Flammeovirgaceae bacterium SG7u.111]|nr:efflux RND transporter periplasmic adaptor subunit [Flammeovirgaceae bacterium SG7u.132]WPO37428.1 efflux RND transporter periplasmic adaptor subunit [Flammeovirgaceae bacterium SG7u.111]